MKLRLFLGMPLPLDVVAAISHATEVLRRDAPNWAGEKWVASENLHITLSFFGDVDEALIPNLVNEIDEATALVSPLILSPLGVRAVPTTRRCRMVWATFEDADGAAAELVGLVRARATALGIALDGKPFKAHSTLCRARRPQVLDVEALNASEQAFLRSAPVVSDPQITLFSSRLTPRGPHYGQIATWQVMGDCHL